MEVIKGKLLELYDVFKVLPNPYHDYVEAEINRLISYSIKKLDSIHNRSIVQNVRFRK